MPQRQSLQALIRLDLLTQDSPSKSVDQNQARLINMYLEPDNSKGKFTIIAHSLPGLTQFCDTGEANIRAMLELNNVTYVVTGNKFGTVSDAGVFAQLGSNLSTSSGFAKITAISGGGECTDQRRWLLDPHQRLQHLSR